MTNLYTILYNFEMVEIVIRIKKLIRVLRNYLQILRNEKAENLVYVLVIHFLMQNLC